MNNLKKLFIFVNTIKNKIKGDMCEISVKNLTIIKIIYFVSTNNGGLKKFSSKLLINQYIILIYHTCSNRANAPEAPVVHASFSLAQSSATFKNKKYINRIIRKKIIFYPGIQKVNQKIICILFYLRNFIVKHSDLNDLLNYSVILVENRFEKIKP
ncbi:hypothetical protein BpHYR1_013821 [Brachionus plicatilis]|uniref:Uncharacterized protein n=1 Tax=Brachionus plicatilis TaxID=10195 RepID=A0A3M7SWX7_BRAPC|nr:hypothetical protein BpHYR1_013821 [Brachionus plicatilis]